MAEKNLWHARVNMTVNNKFRIRTNIRDQIASIGSINNIYED